MRRISRRDVLRESAVLLAVAATGPLASCAHRPDEIRQDRWTKAARIVTSIREPDFPEREFLVSDFGVRPAAENDSRPGLQAAIDACSRAGGGRVVIPEGFWYVDGPLKLRSNLNLHVSEGAHLKFSGNAERYLPVVLTRWEGTDVWNYSPMIFGAHLQNVAITGSGRIDGDGEMNFLPWREKQVPDQNLLRQMGHDGVPVDERIFGPGHWLRPHFIQFYECQNVLVDGPTIVDSPFWVTHLLYCDQAIVRNIEVISHHINSDGVDVDSSSNVLVENCRFDVGDDGVAIKSGRDQDGWRVDRPSRRVVIRNCDYLGHTGGALAIGSEMSGGVADVFVENFRMEQAHHAMYFKSNLDRGGRIERIHLRDITAGEVDSVIIFTNDYHSHRGGDYPAQFENFYLENIACRKARIGLSIIGHPRKPVRGVTVRNLTVDEAETPMQIRYVKDLRFDQVVINGERIRAPGETDEASFNATLTH